MQAPGTYRHNVTCVCLYVDTRQCPEPEVLGKICEEQPQILRLHPSDEDLSPGAPTSAYPTDDETDRGGP